MPYRFNPPPNWRIEDPNFTPPPGWQPDPEWGPAPDGWNFWARDDGSATQSALGNATDTDVRAYEEQSEVELLDQQNSDQAERLPSEPAVAPAAMDESMGDTISAQSQASEADDEFQRQEPLGEELSSRAHDDVFADAPEVVEQGEQIAGAHDLESTQTEAAAVRSDDSDEQTVSYTEAQDLQTQQTQAAATARPTPEPTGPASIEAEQEPVVSESTLQAGRGQHDSEGGWTDTLEAAQPEQPADFQATPAIASSEVPGPALATQHVEEATAGAVPAAPSAPTDEAQQAHDPQQAYDPQDSRVVDAVPTTEQLHSDPEAFAVQEPMPEHEPAANEAQPTADQSRPAEVPQFDGPAVPSHASSEQEWLQPHDVEPVPENTHVAEPVAQQAEVSEPPAQHIAAAEPASANTHVAEPVAQHEGAAEPIAPQSVPAEPTLEQSEQIDPVQTAQQPAPGEVTEASAVAPSGPTTGQPVAGEPAPHAPGHPATAQEIPHAQTSSGAPEPGESMVGAPAPHAAGQPVNPPQYQTPENPGIAPENKNLADSPISEPEKQSFLAQYWWVIVILLVLVLIGLALIVWAVLNSMAGGASASAVALSVMAM